jgi:DNA-binding transcriptional LysR family regulator
MDFNRLKYFTVIAETGSVRAASELLRLSPPALSKALHLLEEEVGAKLVNRSGRNIVLTDAGKTLSRRAKELLEEAETVRREVIGAGSAEQELKLGTFEVFSTHFLGFLNEPFFRKHPVLLHELIPGEIETALVENQIDYGITYLPVPRAEVDHVKISTIEMGVFALKGALEGIIQSDLPFVVPVSPIQGAPTRMKGLDGWPDDSYPRKIRYRVTLMESALEICRQGLAAGYFPLFVVEEHNRRVAPEFRLTRRPSIYPGRVCKTDVYLAKRKSTPENSTLRELAKVIRRTTRR